MDKLVVVVKEGKENEIILEYLISLNNLLVCLACLLVFCLNIVDTQRYIGSRCTT